MTSSKSKARPNAFIDKLSLSLRLDELKSSLERNGQLRRFQIFDADASAARRSRTERKNSLSFGCVRKPVTSSLSTQRASGLSPSVGESTACLVVKRNMRMVFNSDSSSPPSAPFL